MFSRFFIDRPMFAAVISIFIVIIGLAAMISLPIAQYPEIAPPVVTVTATYPGANAEVLEQTVAAPLEEQINGVENMIYMNSSSAANGTVTINVTFDVGTDIDDAAVNVNNRVRLAEPRLPAEARRQGVVVQKSSSSFLQVLALQSPTDRFDAVYLSNYATLNILDRLKRIPGAANVQIFGAKDYAMRIWLRPDRMASLNVTTSDIIRAVQEQNSQYAAGQIGQQPAPGSLELNYVISTQGRLSDPAEFGNIVLRANPDGSILRLKDVARVELGSKDYSFTGKVNGRSAALIGVFLQSGANALDTAQEVKATMDALAARFPEGMTYSVPYDTTRFVEVSIREVVKTLAEAMFLVFLVVYLFLQNWRATVIPMVAVPVSLIGTFAGLFVLGYSINTLTLFGMVLSIGIVVDDAIVVLENVERHMSEEGTAPREAAIRAMSEVTGPVVAIVLVLCAVFVPVAFLGGLAGELYRQFAVTIAIAVVISGIVALTLSPALCASILRHEHKHTHGFFDWFNDWFGRVTLGYTNGVRWMLKHAGVGLALFALMILAAFGLLRIVPGSFVPPEDQGYYITAVILPDAATLSRTERVMDRVEEIAHTNPAAQDSASFAGFDLLTNSYRNAAGTMFVSLKDWSDRDIHVDDAIGELFGRTAAIKEAMVIAFNPPAIMGLGETGGFEFYIQNRAGTGAQQLAQATQQFLAKAAERPELVGLNTLFRPNVPQLRVELDREKARALGVPINEVYDTLAATMGAFYVNDFNLYGRTYTVQMQAEAAYRSQPRDVGGIYVRGGNGQMIPLSALVAVRYVTGPEILERFNNFPAAKVIGSAAPGYSSGQAIAVLEEVAREALSGDFTLDWTGAAYQERRTGGESRTALLLAAVMVFLILAAQYNRLSLPAAVMLAVPFGMFGALLAVWLRGLENDVYFQIGLVTLIGLAAKNAILIVQFAAARRGQGVPTEDAAIEAARLRFRPILMTSMAFILGVLPLAISTGAGAASRHAIGTGVMGGMLAATFLAIFFVPLFFRLVTDWRWPKSRRERAPEGAGDA
ncbi:transporter [Sulfurifustis variabilis]|uniref:Efflux pump membrane transporter n=1 Tax=Sulfurifustis variabilis TaxID=1675686 RepID=A0A1B4V6Z5_9GAMM|nr:efflux RND transporter permease subunit [Sulfurifustis variabilis]BAU48362.1 transporter [Sulfurifustis variabilis]